LEYSMQSVQTGIEKVSVLTSGVFMAYRVGE